MPTSSPAFKFVDIFAGIGGFHAALSAAGGECVRAVEIDKKAAAVYEANWHTPALGDITKQANDEVVTVPKHDLLAAGYPCQPFSKSGFQRGMDEARGTLFWNIARIAEVKRPNVLLLENVRNVAGPRHAHEWAVMIKTLRQLGYRVSDLPAVMSPHLLPPAMGGRPQVRERVFITASYVGEGAPEHELRADPVATNTAVSGWNKHDWDLEKHLPLEEDHHVAGCDLTDAERVWIDAWDDFVQQMLEKRHGLPLEGFPLWADDWRSLDELDALRRMPEWSDVPPWKQVFLRKNAAFFEEYGADVCTPWAAKWGVFTDAFPASRRKLEWQAQDTPRLWDCVMHLRPSGIRAKQPTYLPALVAITQTSIVGSRERRLSPREAARLQGLPEWFEFPGQKAPATYKQLGNGVNVGVVWHMLKEHVERDKDVLSKSAPRLYRAVRDLPASPDDLLEALRG